MLHGEDLPLRDKLRDGTMLSDLSRHSLCRQASVITYRQVYRF